MRSWEEQLRLDLKALNLSETMAVDRCSWRQKIRVVDSFFGNGSVVESPKGAVGGFNISSVRADDQKSVPVLWPKQLHFQISESVNPQYDV
ncbi:hypothetical protein OROGR_027797 [Orobanche gracilis]